MARLSVYACGEEEEGKAGVCGRWKCQEGEGWEESSPQPQEIEQPCSELSCSQQLLLLNRQHVQHDDSRCVPTPKISASLT